MENSNSKILSLGFGLLLILGIGWLAKSYYLDRPTQVAVIGEGMVSVSPTMVTFTVNVVNSAPRATVALADNKKLVKDFINLITGAGVKEQDVVVSYARLIPPTLALGQVDYQAVNSINVTLGNLSGFDNLVNNLYASGASSISDIIFTTENSKDLEKQAVEKAISDAQSRVKELAGSLNKRVGRIVSVSTVEVGQAGALSGQAQTLRLGGGETAGSPSQIEISRQASIIFELR